MSKNMSEDEEKAENDSLSIPVSSFSNLTTDEALARLEDHRCAICQNIIINACRIDCGHSYCRHCLNVDKENRNNGSKPTCFICDAAVTEISQNVEIDKEIDDLYATLSTTERLSRARAKSDRKAEEENFCKRSAERNNLQQENEQNSDESIGSGDASNNRAVTGNSNYADADDDPQERYNCDGVAPIFYGRTFRFYPSQNDYDFSPCNGRDGLLRGDSNNGEFDTMNEHEEINPFPETSPVVIHHTIQHVFHTVEVRHAAGESNEEESNSNLSDRSSECRRDSFQVPTMLTTSRSDHSSRFFRRNLPYESGSCQRHEVPTVPTPTMSTYPRCGFAQTCYPIGYYMQQSPYCGYQHHPAAFVPTRFPSSYFNYVSENSSTTTNTSNAANNFHHHQNTHNYNQGPNIRDCRTAAAAFDDDSNRSSCFPFCGTGFECENIISDDEENDTNFCQIARENEHDITRGENLCEFHRAVQDQQWHHNRLTSPPSCSFSERTGSYERLSPHSRLSNENHFIRDLRMAQEEDLADDIDNENDSVITFQISVPVREGRRQVIERRHSTPEFLGLR